MSASDSIDRCDHRQFYDWLGSLPVAEPRQEKAPRDEAPEPGPPELRNDERWQRINRLMKQGKILPDGRNAPHFTAP